MSPVFAEGDMYSQDSIIEERILFICSLTLSSWGSWVFCYPLLSLDLVVFYSVFSLVCCLLLYLKNIKTYGLYRNCFMLYLPSFTIYLLASYHMDYTGKCSHLHGEEYKLVKSKTVGPHPPQEELPWSVLKAFFFSTVLMYLHNNK